MTNGSVTRRLIAVAALAAGTLVPAALAQTPTRNHPFPEIREARRWGPFLVDPAFVIDNIGFDSNVYFARTDRGAISDLVARLGPDVGIQTHLGRHMAITVRDRLSGEIFAHNSELNHVDNTADAQFDLLLGPLLLTSKGRHVIQRERYNPEFFTGNTMRFENWLGEEARLFFGPAWDIGASYGVMRTRYDNPNRYSILFPDGSTATSTIGEALARDRTESRAEIGWRPRDRFRFFVRAVRRKDDFVNRISAKDRRDTRDTRWFAGVEFNATHFLSGTISFGRSRLEPVDPNSGYNSFSGSVANCRVTYEPARNLRFDMTYQRDAYFSIYAGSLYFLQSASALDVQIPIGTRWGLQAGGSYETYDFPNRTRDTADGSPRHDKVTGYYGGFVVDLRDGLSLGIRYGLRKRDSNVTYLADTQHYVSTTGSYSFGAIR